MIDFLVVKHKKIYFVEHWETKNTGPQDLLPLNKSLFKVTN